MAPSQLLVLWGCDPEWGGRWERGGQYPPLVEREEALESRRGSARGSPSLLACTTGTRAAAATAPSVGSGCQGLLRTTKRTKKNYMGRRRQTASQRRGFPTLQGAAPRRRGRRYHPPFSPAPPRHDLYMSATARKARPNAALRRPSPPKGPWPVPSPPPATLSPLCHTPSPTHCPPPPLPDRGGGGGSRGTRGPPAPSPYPCENGAPTLRPPARPPARLPACLTHRLPEVFPATPAAASRGSR